MLATGVSTYVPAWVKKDAKRFPRAKLRKSGGVFQTTEVLSIFHPEACEADARAFTKLLHHIKEVDEAQSTVLMVQVENEVGLLGDSRDGSPAANERFAQPVPQELINFLKDDWESLHADLKASIRGFSQQNSPSGSWEAVFGKGPHTDELFMAYHYAIYVDHIAAAGKNAHPMLMYTNVWQNYVGDDGDNEFPIIAGGGGQPGTMIQS